MKNLILTIFCLVIVGLTNLFAQSTEFTYQGRLLDGSLPANANYDFEFRLFAAESGGGAIGTVSRPEVVVSAGSFTVKLDFGASFDGTPRWLEIAVKPAGSGTPFTTLTPRQTISSAPYAIRSLNAASAETAANSLQLGGVAANQFVITTDTRLSDERNPLPNSPNYINNTTSPQAAANFNVSGNGALGGTLSANSVTSATQFNIGVNRALALGTASVYAGRLAGTSNTAGSGNSFFGDSAGRFNATGSNNSFFGRDAGLATTEGDNSFFGAFSGDSNTSGTRNSFFGALSGDSNQLGSDNSFFGHRAGRGNTSGAGNSFFGSSAGRSNTTGDQNSFYGFNAGGLNSTGNLNSFFGYLAGEVNTSGTANSFFGERTGRSNTTGTGNSFFGGLAGQGNTIGVNNSYFGNSSGSSAASVSNNSFFGNNAGASNTGSNNSFFGYRAGISNDASGNSFFGYFSGLANGTGTENSFFGSESGVSNTTGSRNSLFGVRAGASITTGFANTIIGAFAGENLVTGSGNVLVGDEAGRNLTSNAFNNAFFGGGAGMASTLALGNTFIGTLAGNTNVGGDSNTAIGAFADVASANLSHATAIGSGSVVSASNTIALGRASGADRVVLYGLGSGGSQALCRDTVNFQISNCSSSLRYKTNVKDLTRGLEVVRSLRPVTFDWKQGGMTDIGFVAEEVREIEPLLATTDSSGQIEGVKYAQVTTVLVNAVKQQQEIIERQQKQIDALLRLACRSNPDAEECKLNGERP